MNTSLKLLIILVALVGLIDAVRFFGGRRFHHLLNRKNHDHQKIADIPEQYFDQRLDHFNEAVNTTWKQVSQPPQTFKSIV